MPAENSDHYRAHVEGWSPALPSFLSTMVTGRGSRIFCCVLRSYEFTLLSRRAQGIRSGSLGAIKARYPSIALRLGRVLRVTPTICQCGTRGPIFDGCKSGPYYRFSGRDVGRFIKSGGGGQERFSTHFFPCNTIGLMFNFAKVGWATAPTAPELPASLFSGKIWVLF